MFKKKTINTMALFLRSIVRLFNKNKKSKILIDAPHYFHYLHVKSIVESLSKRDDVELVVIKWHDYIEAHAPENACIEDRESIKKNFFNVYDIYLTTEYGGIIEWFNKKTKKIFLLHGVGPKATYIKDNYIKRFDYIFCPGQTIYNLQKEIVDDNVIVKSGLPVTDRILSNDAKPKESYSFLDSNKPMILYAPSWSSNPELITLNVEFLLNLKKQEICNVLVKPHPLLLNPDRCGGFSWLNAFNEIEDVNIKFVVDSTEAIYTHLSNADIMIGDISSVLYEYMILDRPVIVYAKDNLFSSYEAEKEYALLLESVYRLHESNDLVNVLEKALKSDSLSDKRKNMLGQTFYQFGNSTNYSVNQMLSICDAR